MPTENAPWEQDQLISAAGKTGPDKGKPWEQDEAPFTSFEDKAGAVAQGALGGVAEAGPLALSTGVGAAIGSGFGPVGTVVGGGAGFAYGLYAGKKTREGVASITLPSGKPATYKSVEDAPKGLRPFFAGGETLGQTAPFAFAAPYAATRVTLPDTLIGKWTQKIFDSFIQRPGTFMAAETSGAIGAAVGAAASTELWPGDKLARAGSEVIGGFFNPTRLVVGASGMMLDTLRSARQAMSSSGRQTAAGRWLTEQIVAAGDDPELLVRLLQQTSPIPGTQMTAAQRTGSEGLAVVEARLREESKKFGGTAERQTEATLEALNNAVVALRGTGDPQALTLAAQLQESQYKLYVDSMIKGAEKEAIDTARSITSDPAEMRMELGRRAFETLGAALSDARVVEKQLWSKVPKDLGLEPQKTLEAFTRVTDDMLPEIRRELPSSVLGFIARMKGLPAPGAGTPEDVQRLVKEIFGDTMPVREEQYFTNAGELLAARSNFLEKARSAAASNNFQEERIFNALAEGALDDLNRLNMPEATEARAFSKSLHDSFTRTFASDVLRKQASGRQRTAPELLLKRVTAGGSDATAFRMAEMEEATRFLQTQNRSLAYTEDQIDQMLDVQQRMLRLAARETITAEGRVNSRKLSQFIQNNELMLKRFPDVADDLKKAVNSEVKLIELISSARNESKLIPKRTAFGRIIQVENPVDAVNSALRSGTPVELMTEFGRLATKAGPEAVEGLRVTVWDHVLRQATSTTGEFSTKKMGQALLEPIRPGQTSLGDLMRSMGIFKRGELENAERFLQEIEKVMKVTSTRTTVETEAGTSSALFDLALRYVGAAVGSLVAHGGPGHELIAAQRGSAYMRQVFAKVPQGKIQDILVEALLQPDNGKLIKLLETEITSKNGLKLSRQIHAYLASAGLTAIGDDE